MPRLGRPWLPGVFRAPVVLAAGLLLSAALLLGTSLFDRGARAEAGQLIDVHMRIAVPQGAGEWRELDLKLLLVVEPGADAAREAEIAREGMLARFPGAVDLLRGDAAARYKATGYSWAEHSATFSYNPAGRPAGMDGDDGAVSAGAAPWNSAGAAWTFVRGANTSAGPGLCQDGTPDGISAVAWVPSLPGSTLATTCTYYPGGSVKESDIALDASRPWTTDPANVEIDLQSVALHEFGHMLGLGHSGEREAVMYGTYPRHRSRRELTADDLAGLLSIYGQATATATPEPPASATPEPPAPKLLVPALAAN